MGFVERVALAGEKINSYNVLVGELKEGDHSEELGVGGMIILNWIFK